MAKKFKVLVIGSGGREFAFLRKLLWSDDVYVHVAPGLSGMLYFLNEEVLGRVKLYPEVKATNIRAICQLAQEIMPDLIIIGPDDPIALGLTDELLALGLKVFGFTKSAGRLESSKWFCKDVYKHCGLPSAPATLIATARQAKGEIIRLAMQGLPVVIKCDGLALGKGVVIVPLDHPDYWGEIERQVRLMFDPQKPLGFQAEKVLLEYRYPMLNEWSAMHLLGPNQIAVPLMPTKDHKLLDGKNTGGMGIVTPAPGFSMSDMSNRNCHVNVLRCHMQMVYGTELCGILYEGLNRMMGVDYCVEVNARGGDPETQGQLEFLLGVPLHELLLGIVEGDTQIASRVIMPQNQFLVGVVMASKGYPGDYSAQLGKEISFPGYSSQQFFPMCFPSGLTFTDGKLRISGGRVLMVVGTGPTLSAARKAAYDRVGQVKHDGALVWRNDIGLES
ncbi:MAG: hypothetical protein NTX82_07100 [Candidatus Parcubacteria bacterium]|nr:hypothetical protein [Candidatus Parcubacteria bacterium]